MSRIFFVVHPGGDLEAKRIGRDHAGPVELGHRIARGHGGQLVNRDRRGQVRAKDSDELHAFTNICFDKEDAR